jgi:multidrug transporter EmrE-like cation transporter
MYPAPTLVALITMLFVCAGSALFCLGGAFMKASHGFTVPFPSIVVAMSFMVGAVCLSRAVTGQMLSTTLIIGLGVEALGAVALGVFVLGERLSLPQTGGVALVISGVVLLRL